MLSLQAILKRRPHERCKQRMRGQRFRFEFGMELAAEEPWMLIARQLNDLDELAVGRDPAEDEPALLQGLSISRIEFISVTMALADFSRSVIDVTRQRAFGQVTHPRPQAHRAAHLFDVHQITQLE